jgi:hypothetical protein
MDKGIIDERRIENVVSKFWRILIVSVCLVCFVALGTAFAQKDVKYDGGKDGAVTFVHKAHVGGQKLKCDNCHKDPNLFTKKKEAKITEADHEGKKRGLPRWQESLCNDDERRLRQVPQEIVSFDMDEV